MAIQIIPALDDKQTVAFNRRKYNKFHVSPKADRTVDGKTFSSKLESRVYTMFRDAGLHFDLQPRYVLQPKFDLNGRHYREIAYVADFLLHTDAGDIIVDAKGIETDVFKLKQKMMAFVHHVDIVTLTKIKDIQAFINTWVNRPPPAVAK